MGRLSEDLLLSPDELEEAKEEQSSPPASLRWFIAVAVALVVGIIAGYQTGRWNVSRIQAQVLSNVVPQVPVSLSSQIFRQDGRFATHPPLDGGSEAAWDSLIPTGLGNIKHPKYAPEPSFISVFHQLHCLYTLRRIYFSKVDNGTLEAFDNGVERDEHAIHCFEYLRQALMCSSDSNVEPLDFINGFTGWNINRQCRDYQQLKQWAERWRSNDLQGFVLNLDHSTVPELQEGGATR